MKIVSGVLKVIEAGTARCAVPVAERSVRRRNQPCKTRPLMPFVLRTIVIALVMAAATVPTVLFAQTKNEAANPIGENTADGKTLIVPWESVGPIHRGMSSNEVVAILGQPEKMQGKIMVYGKSSGLAIAGAGHKEGVAVIFCGDSAGDGLGVKAFKCRTKEGIGMGSSRAEIIKAFGQPTWAPPDVDIREEVLVYQSLGLTFTLQNGKVYNIQVDFRKPQKPLPGDK